MCHRGRGDLHFHELRHTWRTGSSPGLLTCVGLTHESRQSPSVLLAQSRVLPLSDGSYAVHRIGNGASTDIFVSTDFKVAGTACRRSPV